MRKMTGAVSIRGGRQLTGSFGEPTMGNDDGWEHYVNEVTLRYDGRKWTFPYRRGLAHSPNSIKLIEVLSSVWVDHESYLSATTFEEFCWSYGYDTDSRSALALFESLAKAEAQLHVLLEGDFDQVLRAIDVYTADHR